MQMTRFTKSLSLIVCIVLLAAMALFTTGCNDNKETGSSSASATVSVSSTLGEGNTQFIFTVIDTAGKETAFEIHTDKTIVGDALQELGLIAGEESAYGLYVKTVNGVTVDYDKDGKYWAFYVNGQYAATGVDATQITAGDTYSFKAE